MQAIRLFFLLVLLVIPGELVQAQELGHSDVAIYYANGSSVVCELGQDEGTLYVVFDKDGGVAEFPVSCDGSFAYSWMTVVVVSEYNADSELMNQYPLVCEEGFVPNTLDGCEPAARSGSYHFAPSW